MWVIFSDETRFGRAGIEMISSKGRADSGSPLSVAKQALKKVVEKKKTKEQIVEKKYFVIHF